MQTKFMLATIAIAAAYCLAISGGCAKKKTYVIEGDCSPIVTTPQALMSRYGDKLVFNSGRPSELARCLSSPHHLEDARITKLYSVTLPALETGDLISASFTAEFTSELPVEAWLAHFVEIKNANTGEVVHRSPRHGTNILPLVHHLTIGETVYYAAADGADYTIDVYAYSATGNWSVDIQNGHLTVESGYGSLQGMVLR